MSLTLRFRYDSLTDAKLWQKLSFCQLSHQLKTCFSKTIRKYWKQKLNVEDKYQKFQ